MRIPLKTIIGDWLVPTCGALALSISFGEAIAAKSKAPAAAAEQRTGPSVVYASIDECIISKLLNQAECKRAFANARAEFLEKAPRFSDRRACEALFGACSIALVETPASAKPRSRAPSLEYGPQFGRVKIIVLSRDQREAIPALTGGPVPVTFQPRSVAIDDVNISPARSLAAKSAWQAAINRQKQMARPVYATPSRGGAAPGVDDDPPIDSNAPVQTYPVGGERWNQMQSQIRKLGAEPARKPNAR